ncbi:MAG: hypothetical protein OWT28_07745 [Firmicutes bacterium]|nr:hypothetical protein [Bacillota bacterium]
MREKFITIDVKYIVEMKKMSQEEIKKEIDIQREILKQILVQKKLIIHINDISNLSLPSEYFMTENLVTLPFIKSMLSEQEIDFVDFVDKKIFRIDTEKIATKYILYKTTDCTKQNSIFSVLLQKADELGFKIKMNTKNFNQKQEIGKIYFEIYDGDKKLATIVKKSFYCNNCLDNPEVNVGVQKCVKFYIK